MFTLQVWIKTIIKIVGKQLKKGQPKISLCVFSNVCIHFSVEIIHYQILARTSFLIIYINSAFFEQPTQFLHISFIHCTLHCTLQQSACEFLLDEHFWCLKTLLLTAGFSSFIFNDYGVWGKK